MTPIIDCHVHVFGKPDIFSNDRVSIFRKQARSWMKPFSTSLHSFHPHLRYLPDFIRKNLDWFSSFVPIPNLLLESSPSDLIEAMNDSGIDFALVIAHPPLISNHFVMELCANNPRLIPVVNIPKGAPRPSSILKKYARNGAKALKIHIVSDGEDINSRRYHSLLKSASDLGLPVIIDTGWIPTHIIYKDPQQGHAEHFSKWYESYPHTKFILAHMNFHNPGAALDLCEKYPNLFVETSWQPAEVIGEAVRRIGADRILFGTAWPFVGNNLFIGRERLKDCVETGLLNEEQAGLILGGNAIKLLGLPVHAN